jgi:hypothetical protein
MRPADTIPRTASQLRMIASGPLRARDTRGLVASPLFSSGPHGGEAGGAIAGAS